jgi:hypothetical protein
MDAQGLPVSTATLSSPEPGFLPRHVSLDAVTTDWIPPAVGVRRRAARGVAQVIPPEPVRDEAGVVIPPYRQRKDHYTKPEWQGIVAAFQPTGQITSTLVTSLSLLANQPTGPSDHPYRWDRLSALALGLGARVERHLMSPRLGEQTQDSLREVVQREFLPARERLIIMARTMGSGEPIPADDANLSWYEIRNRVDPRRAFLYAKLKDLPEAWPMLRHGLDLNQKQAHEMNQALLRPASMQVSRELTEILGDHFAAGGTDDWGPLTASINRRWRGEWNGMASLWRNPNDCRYRLKHPMLSCWDHNESHLTYGLAKILRYPLVTERFDYWHGLERHANLRQETDAALQRWGLPGLSATPAAA